MLSRDCNLALISQDIALNGLQIWEFFVRDDGVTAALLAIQVIHVLREINLQFRWACNIFANDVLVLAVMHEG